MGAKARKAFHISVFAVACATTVLSSVGCQSGGTAVSPTNPMCPVCGQATEAQARGEIDSTRVICPVCGDVETVDPQFLERLEIFTGGPLGDTVYACAQCRALVEQCVVCRQEGRAVARQNGRSWHWGLPSTP